MTDIAYITQCLNPVGDHNISNSNPLFVKVLVDDQSTMTDIVYFRMALIKLRDKP